jgi:hypothetical protein
LQTDCGLVTCGVPKLKEAFYVLIAEEDAGVPQEKVTGRAAAGMRSWLAQQAP